MYGKATDDCHLLRVKKEEMTEGRKASWASEIEPGPLISTNSGSVTDYIQLSLLRMSVEAYETLSHNQSFYDIGCFFTFVTAVCIYFCCYNLSINTSYIQTFSNLLHVGSYTYHYFPIEFNFKYLLSS